MLAFLHDHVDAFASRLLLHGSSFDFEGATFYICLCDMTREKVRFIVSEDAWNRGPGLGLGPGVSETLEHDDIEMAFSIAHMRWPHDETMDYDGILLAYVLDVDAALRLESPRSVLHVAADGGASNRSS